MTADAQSTTVAVPSGTVNGDLLVLFACNEATNHFSTLSGWTILQTDTTDGAADCDGAFWWRTASSEPASYTLTITGGSSYVGLISAAMFRVEGFNTASPIRTSALTKTTTAATTSPAPGTLTGVTATDLVLIGYGYGGGTKTSAAPTMTYPSTGSWTHLGTSGPTSHASDYQGALMMVSKLAGTDTPTGSSSVAGGWVVMSVVIEAALHPSAFMPFFM
jgi:hypothetical protein